MYIHMYIQTYIYISMLNTRHPYTKTKIGQASFPPGALLKNSGASEDGARALASLL